MLQNKEDFFSDLENVKRVNKKIVQIEKTLAEFKELNGSLADIGVLIELGVEAGDESLTDEINLELKTAENKVQTFWLKTLLNGKYDLSSAIITLHAGAGGTESCDWVSMLYRMYLRYCEKNGFNTTILDTLDGDGAGYKSVTFLVEGEYAYGYLKAERGVHRLVRISPFDANKKRHTSFASMEVIPELEDDSEIEINMEEVKIDTYRAS